MSHRDEGMAAVAGRARRAAIAIVAPFLVIPWLAAVPLPAQDEEAADEPVLEGRTDGIDEEGLQTIQEILEAEAEDLAGDGYGYDPAGRRDPFVSLIGPRTGPLPDEECEEIGCLLIDEIDITGVFITSAGPVAQAYSTRIGRSYLLREGDELADGDLLQITAERVVFKQYVEDARTLKPFQEVVKELNP